MKYIDFFGLDYVIYFEHFFIGRCNVNKIFEYVCKVGLISTIAMDIMCPS